MDNTSDEVMKLKIDLSSKALIQLGASSIESFDDLSGEAEVANLLFESTFYSWLLDGCFLWATDEVSLGKPQSKDTSGNYEYKLPHDFLALLSFGEFCSNEHLIDYKIKDDKLFTKKSRGVLKYLRNVSVSEIPLWCYRSFIITLAAEFCLPLTNSPSRYANLKREASYSINKLRKFETRYSRDTQIVSCDLFTNTD